MKNKPTKGLIYFRVSTEEQAQFGISLDQQKNSCLEYAQKNHIEIVEIFHDNGVSAKTTNRLGLQNLINFCKKHKNINCIIIYKIDRLSRNTYDYAKLFSLFSKLKIKLISVTEAINDTPMGKFMGTFMAANAQLDNDMKSERVTSCMTEKYRQGFWCWEAPIGYLNSTNKFNKKIIITDKKRVPLIKLIFEKYSTGLYTLEEIRKIVNKKGLKTRKGNELSMQTMSKIIRRSFYFGIMKRKGEEQKGNYKPIISEKIFYKCQQLLKDTKSGNTITKSKINEDFPLRHFVLCAYCGRPLTASFSTGRWGGKFPYYRCYNSKCPSKKSIAKNKIEEEFIDYLKAITPNKKYINRIKPVIVDVWKTKYKEINKKRGSESEKLESFKNEKAELIRMKKKNLIEDEDFKEEFNKVKQQILEQHTALNETELKEYNIEEATDYVFNFVEEMAKLWETTTLEEKIKIQGLIFPEKPIYKYNGFETPNISLVFAKKRELATAKSPVVPPRGVEPLLLG